MRKQTRFLFAGLIGLLWVVEPAPVLAGELQLSLYGGDALTHDTDVDLERPGGTDLTFEDVSFASNSFTSPYYYGARLSYWFGRRDEWGVMLDFTHAKLESKLDDVVKVSGRRSGAPVSADEPLSNTFQQLNFSHGHNLLTLNGARRWLVFDRIRPYIGIGAGVAIPHVEVTIDGAKKLEHQIAGPAVQGLVGASVDLIDYLSVFGEYKLSYARIDGDLGSGSSIRIDPLTHHFVFGLSANYRF